LVVRKKGSTLDTETLLDHMRPKIASWWVPDAVEFLDEFPMTGTGKVRDRGRGQNFRSPIGPILRRAKCVKIRTRAGGGAIAARFFFKRHEHGGVGASCPGCPDDRI
jgi:hypothetical protein